VPIFSKALSIFVQALVKRSAQLGINSGDLGANQSPSAMETALPSCLRRRLSSALHEDKKEHDSKEDKREPRWLLAGQLKDEVTRILININIQGLMVYRDILN